VSLQSGRDAAGACPVSQHPQTTLRFKGDSSLAASIAHLRQVLDRDLGWQLMRPMKCDHQTSFGDLELTCSVYGCERRPRRCVVYLALGMADVLMFQVKGACWLHVRKVRRTALSLHIPPGWPEPQSRPADLDALLGWYHGESGFCRFTGISVATPGATLPQNPA